MDERSEYEIAQAGEAKKQLEALAGRALDISVEELFSLWFPAGASSYNDGSVTWKNVLRPGKSCRPGTLFDASGVSSTGGDGKRVLLLSDFVCFPPVTSLAEPINVVATPRATTPFFLTMTHDYLRFTDPAHPQDDVRITVFTWDANGAAAPNVAFDWRCRVVSIPIIG